MSIHNIIFKIKFFYRLPNFFKIFSRIKSNGITKFIITPRTIPHVVFAAIAIPIVIKPKKIQNILDLDRYVRLKINSIRI